MSPRIPQEHRHAVYIVLTVSAILFLVIWLLPFQPFPDIDQGFAPFGPLDKADGGG